MATHLVLCELRTIMGPQHAIKKLTSVRTPCRHVLLQAPVMSRGDRACFTPG